MEDVITRAEHDEFCRRMEDEHKRINHRVGTLEETVRQIGALTSSVEQLAANMKRMLESQNRQEARLEELESRDGEMWRNVTGHIITIIIGVVVGYIFTQIGF